MRRIGGTLLLLWGAIHAVGAVAWGSEAGDPSMMPGWSVRGAIAFSALLVIAGGIGFLGNRRWALMVSVVGLVALLSVPLLFIAGRLGWAGLDYRHHFGKLGVSVAILALSIMGERTSRRAAQQQDEADKARAG